MATTTDLIQQLYVAYFNRPADVAGLAFWVDAIDNKGVSLDTVSKNFNTAPEYTAAYAGKSADAIVNTVYQNLFGRTADSAGLNFWGPKIAAGTISTADLVKAITAGALNADGTPNADGAIFNNKVAAAEAFTADIGAAGNEALRVAYSSGTASVLATAKAFIAGVTTDASLAAAVAGVHAAASGLIPAPVPTTFNLTSAADTLTGTAAADVFVAGATLLPDGTTAANALQSVDSIDGGAGVDTLKVTFAAAGTPKPIMTNVENVVATFNAAATLDLTGSTGVGAVTVTKSTTTGTVSGTGAAALTVSNQNFNVAFDKVTGDAITLSVDTVGKSSALQTIDLGATVASKATSESLTLNNAYIKLDDTTNNTGITSATVAATGKNAINFTDAAGTLTKLTVTGAGSLDVSATALTTLTTLTAGDGGVKVDATGGVLKTVTTGAGADTITAVGATVGTFSLGAGNDKVTAVTSALAAASSIDLGAGDDTLTLNVAPTAGVTLAGGAGVDTLAVAAATYTSISGFSAANLAKVTGFEVLSITGAALADATTYDLSAVAGLTSFQSQGVVATKAASVTNVGANSSIILAGATGTNSGTLTVSLKDNTGASDVLNLTINQDVTDDADGSANSAATGTAKITTTGVETLNVTSTSTLANAGAGDDLDFATNTLTLSDDAIVTVKVTGDSAFSFATVASMTKLATIDASALTQGATIDGSLSAAASAALSIKGSATAANTLTGGAAADTIVGGAKADIIKGGAGGDTLTGGAGNDTFVFTAGDSTIGTGTFDTITDFKANTYGAGTGGAVDTHGAFGVAANKLTGDLIKVAATAAAATDTVKTFVATSAADATTFLANNMGATTVSAALDSSTGNLYIDNTGDGVADFYIHLTGVTTINAAAILLV